VLRAVSDVVKGYGNKISVEGFTDTLEFAPQIASNWELSVAWASAARQEIEAHGIEKERFLFIAGYGSTKLLLKELPQDHRNRRIVITIFYPAY
jgi:flagellar motor protein MotB